MKQAILLDTNLLLVVVAGYASLSYLGHQERLKEYDREDFRVLIKEISRYKVLLTTPNIVTETSNLIYGLRKEHIREKVLAQFTKMLSGVTEIYVESRICATNRHFQRLGVTDISFFTADSKACLWTNDRPLYEVANREGVEVQYFNYLPHRFK